MIGCEKSLNTEIFDLKTLKKIVSIEAHVHKEITCYFIEGNKAVTISDDQRELFCWDIKDM